VKDPTVETFARRPREALMWLPRARDVARVGAACRAAGGLVADVGAGTGLLARLLEQAGAKVAAYDPSPAATQYHPVERLDADQLTDSYDAAIVSWMEAGKDYRAPVADIAPVIVNCFDVEGGCGVMGETDFAQHGFQLVETWRTPSFEDALHALEHRGLRRAGYPGNRIDVLTRKPHLLEPLRAAIDGARAGKPLPWEAEMDALNL
jgi:SAM-dependent methyltransferase